MTKELTTLSQTPCKFTFDDDKVWENSKAVLYMADGEHTTFLPLGDLIRNFNENGGWHDRCNAEDMRDEIFGRGWYEGSHTFGRYLVVDVAKINAATNLPHYFRKVGA